jgi:hypothetical protein
VNESQGFLAGQITYEGDYFDLVIQKISSDDAVAAHSSGIWGGAEFGINEFEVFRKVNNNWQLDQAALADIAVSNFYQNQEAVNVLNNVLEYWYQLDPALQELQVELTLPDHYSPHMNGGDSASLALFEVFQSNQYKTLVMNWDSAGHKYLIKEKKLNTQDSVEVWDNTERRYFKKKKS